MNTPAPKYTDEYLSNRRALEVKLYRALDPIPISQGFRVSFIDATASVDEVWAFDNSVYPDANISRETLLKWRASFPFGGYCLRDVDDVLQGVIGIWPVSEAMAARLVAPDFREDELSPVSDTTDGLCSVNWYFSGFAVAPRFRGTPVTRFFLCSALLLWSAIARGIKPPIITGIAYSEAGERILRRANFQLIRRNNAGEGIYRMSCQQWVDVAMLLTSSQRHQRQ
jgi:hypothetical protein